jgi:hypothetical protein
VKSEGFAVPLDWMAFTGYDTSKLKEGDQFDTLNGVPICNKYFTKATLAAMQGNKKKNSLKAAFPEHWETTQYRFAHLDAGDLVVITEKEHGTSVRYGYVEVAREKNWFEKLVAKVGYYTRSKTEKFSMEYLLGTRRTILAKKKQIAFNKKDFWVTNHNDEFEFVGGFYGDGEPYKLAAIKLNGKLKDSEIVYGELVGYCTNGSPLFTHSLVKLPDLEKTYGSPMVYSYGCVPGNGRLRVYRITHNGRDLSWFEKVKRCKELGVEMVTEMGRFVYDGNKDALDARIQSMLEGPSLIDGTHMREGVCIWVENEHGIKVYKEKSYSFKLAEGIVKENDSYVDAEEAA